MCSMSGGTPHVSMADVALAIPLNLPRSANLPLPAPATTTCLSTDLELLT